MNIRVIMNMIFENQLTKQHNRLKSANTAVCDANLSTATRTSTTTRF